MYSGDLSTRDRAGPIGAVILVHLALGAMLLGMSGHLAPGAVEQSLKLFDVRETPLPEPPPPPPPPKSRPTSANPKAAAPPAKKAEATPIVAPKPRIVIPAPTPVAAAPVPNVGAAPSQGAATAGSGTGAGGSGSGTGGGGSGNGSGDGDDGSGTHPRPLFRPLNPRGFPRDLIEDLPPGARVFILFTVQLDGRVTDCTIRESSGVPALDAMVCQVAQQRFRYDPARHADGRPYVAKSAYMQVF